MRKRVGTDPKGIFRELCLPSVRLVLLLLLCPYAQVEAANCSSLGYVAPSKVMIGLIAGLSDPVAYQVEFSVPPSSFDRAMRSAIYVVNQNLSPGAPIFEAASVDVSPYNGRLISDAFYNLIGGPDPVGMILGPSLQVGDSILSSLAAPLGVPIGSIGVTGLWLSDKFGFPSFFRLVPGVTTIGKSLNALFGLMKVRRFAYVQEEYNPLLGQFALQLADEVQAGLMAQLDDDVDPSLIRMAYGAKDTLILEALNALKAAGNRYVVVEGSTRTFARFIYWGHVSGMFVNRDDPYVVTGAIHMTVRQIRDWALNAKDLTAPGSATYWGLPAEAKGIDIIHALMSVVVGQTITAPDTEHVAALVGAYQILYPDDPSLSMVNVYSPRCADGVFFMREVLNEAQRNDELCFLLGSSTIPRAPRMVAEYLRKTTAIGASGSIVMSPELEAYGNVSFYRIDNLYSADPRNFSLVPLLTYYPGTSRWYVLSSATSATTTSEGAISAIKTIRWNSPRGTGYIPLDAPPEPKKVRLGYLIGLPVGLAGPLLLLICCIVAFKISRMQTLKRSVELVTSLLQDGSMSGMSSGTVPVRLGSLRLATYNGQPVSLQDIGGASYTSIFRIIGTGGIFSLFGQAPVQNQKIEPVSAADTEIIVQRTANGEPPEGGAASYHRSPSWSLYEDKQGWPRMPWQHALVVKLQSLRHRNIVATLGTMRTTGHGTTAQCIVHEYLATSLRRKLEALKGVKVKRKITLLHDVASALIFLKNAMPYGPKRPMLLRGARLDHIWLDPAGTAKVGPSLEDNAPQAGLDATEILTAPELYEIQSCGTEASDVFFLGSLAFLLLYSLDEPELVDRYTKYLDTPVVRQSTGFLKPGVMSNNGHVTQRAPLDTDMLHAHSIHSRAAAGSDSAGALSGGGSSGGPFGTAQAAAGARAIGVNKSNKALSYCRFPWVLDTLPSGLPPGLVTMLKRATAVNHEERPTLLEVAAAIEPKIRSHIITE